MKKTLLLAILLLPTFAFATIDSNLKYGSRGVEVTELQEFLIDKGFLTGQPTGNFFALTKKAVISYQKSVNLPATGFVGQLTRAEINKELAVNDEAEIQETGAVNQPVSNNVDDLLKKIADITEQQKAQQEQTNRLIESIKEPKVGGVISVPQPVDKSEITAEVIRGPFGYRIDDQPYGIYFIKVSMIGSDGRYVINNPIRMQSNNDKDNLKINNSSDEIRNAGETFGYYPTSAGLKTLTFTSGNLSKSITINVPDKPYVSEYQSLYTDTINKIKELNNKLNNVEKDVQEEFKGRGVTSGGIAPIIEDRKKQIIDEIKQLSAKSLKIKEDFANSVPLTN